MSNSSLPADRGPASIRRAQASEIPLALGLILGSGGQSADPATVAQFQYIARHRQMNLDDIRLVIVRDRLIWAVLPLQSPGRTALMLGSSSELARGFESSVGQAIEQACDQCGKVGVQLAQVLIEPADRALQDIYHGHQFEWMAELIYLHRTLRRTMAQPPLPTGLSLETYHPANHADFAATILDSYQDSLDCPGLSGLREMEDVIAGHKAAGIFDPGDWFLLRAKQEPIAVILLSLTLAGDAMELIYLGLAPSVRGRGLGEWLMKLAWSRLAVRGVNRLCLAVDAINKPALRLYYRHGLVRLTSKVALMRKLESNAE